MYYPEVFLRGNKNEFMGLKNIEFFIYITFTGTIVEWAEALVCAPQELQKEGYLWWQAVVDFYLISTVNTISVISLLILLIHQWREQRQKLFGAMKLSTIAMLLVFNVTLTILKFQGSFEARQEIWVTKEGTNNKVGITTQNGSVVTNFHNEIKENWPALCYLEGLILQYSFLSTLMWLNALSFDVWMNFRKIRAPKFGQPRFGGRAIKSGFGHPKYIKYATYSWIVPLLNLIGTLVMDFLPSHITEGLILPNIGKQRCATKDYMV